MSVIVIRSVQINKRIEWLAICFILLVGLTSVAAAVTRYAVLVWIWTGPSDGRRLTAGNFGLIEICVRLEIIFGAAAYGLCFARSLMRRTIKYFMELSESLRSIVSSRSSRGKSDHQEEEDERVLKPASLASGPGYDLEEMRGPG